MARDTYGSITALIRMVADDRDQSGGVVFQDADLLPYVNAALLDLNIDLINAGSPIAKKFFTVNFTTSDVNIDFVTPPLLPADFLTPATLWEKLLNDPDRNYTQMDQTGERLPDIDQVDRLRYWMWTGNAIQTLGATAARTVRCEYYSEATPFAVASDFIPFPGAKNVLAYDALFKASISRGDQVGAEAAKQMYMKAYEQYKRMHIKSLQRRPRRKVPYGMGRPFRY